MFKRGGVDKVLHASDGERLAMETGAAVSNECSESKRDDVHDVFHSAAMAAITEENEDWTCIIL